MEYHVGYSNAVKSIVCCLQTPSTVEQQIKDDVSNSLTPVSPLATSCVRAMQATRDQLCSEALPRLCGL
jgi:predicted short-subunit dehydrogenase-like oxidoreductase (DUF2520 family)